MREPHLDPTAGGLAGWWALQLPQSSPRRPGPSVHHGVGAVALACPKAGAGPTTNLAIRAQWLPAAARHGSQAQVLGRQSTWARGWGRGGWWATG